MPIANCIVTPHCQPGSGDLVERWASESGQSPEHMTVNIMTAVQQYGKEYHVMATLWLPSVWSDAGITSLQVGLARALAKHFDLALKEVHVMTRIVESGRVVEDGQEIHW